MDVQIRVDEKTHRVVEALVEAGEFETPEAVVREGVRRLHEQTDRRARLLALVQPAIDSIARGEGIPAEKAFAELRARYEERI